MKCKYEQEQSKSIENYVVDVIDAVDVVDVVDVVDAADFVDVVDFVNIVDVVVDDIIVYYEKRCLNGIFIYLSSITC